MIKHTLRTNALRTIALSLALATGAAGLAQAARAEESAAATPPAQTQQHAGRHAMHHHAMKPMHRPGFGPAMGSPLALLPRLEHRLKLTDSQQTLWRAARSQQAEAGKALREQFGKNREELRKQVEAGPLDLRALTTQQEAARNAVRPRLDAARDAWLAAYDSLDAQQKQVVTDAFKRTLEHRRGPRHGERGHGSEAPARS
ncbi:hypothetical protein GCM10023144_12280 [Pigmentiphaga soli]|uniref:Periplasmic heavy metal sensor n=1 Tax=Pigmentiphaga soli TaxID=1007095 RepID=A0ABP8GNK8_9BURK